MLQKRLFRQKLRAMPRHDSAGGPFLLAGQSEGRDADEAAEDDRETLNRLKAELIMAGVEIRRAR